MDGIDESEIQVNVCVIVMFCFMFFVRTQFFDLCKLLFWNMKRESNHYYHLSYILTLLSSSSVCWETSLQKSLQTEQAEKENYKSFNLSV